MDEVESPDGGAEAELAMELSGISPANPRLLTAGTSLGGISTTQMAHLSGISGIPPK